MAKTDKKSSKTAAKAKEPPVRLVAEAKPGFD
jgi:hypothetical protein